VCVREVRNCIEFWLEIVKEGRSHEWEDVTEMYLKPFKSSGHYMYLRV